MLDHKGFDLWADGYDQAVGVSEEANSYPFAGYKDVLDGIFKEIMLKEKACVLDIGFGTGTLTSKLYENGCEIYGQDFSQRMLELAKEKMPRATLYQGDFTRGLAEELRNRKYDFILGTYSLHHLSDQQKIVFFSELLKLLKDDGKLLIGDVAFERREDLERCRSEAGDCWDEDEIYFVAEELGRSFEKLSFTPKSYCAGIIEIKA